jgi:hypothetical protein
MAVERQAVGVIVGKVVKHQRIIIVSGIPASGKSTYARWLASSKRYSHLDIDFAANAGKGLGVWLESMRQSKQNGVIDWGFPPSCLDTVEWLVSQGVERWWFDGDHAAAKVMFLERRKREEHPAEIEAFTRQMAQIKANWDKIEKVFQARIIHSILPGPTYLEAESIFGRMGL